MGQQQVALQIPGYQLVGLIVIIRGAAGLGFQQALPFLGPIVFIFAIVVVAGLGDTDLEEIGVVEHGAGSGIAAAGVAVDAGAVDVDPREALRQLAHAGNLIRERVVAEIAEVGFVEFLTAPRRAHAIDFHHDEAEFGQRLAIGARRGETATPHAPGLRPRVNMVDDGILPGGVEVGGLEHQAVKIGDAVARLDGERHGRLPSGRGEPGDIGALQGRQHLAVVVAEDGDSRDVGLGPAIDEVVAGGG